MHSTLRLLLASLLVPAVVLLGETVSLAQYPPAAPPPGYGPPPGQPMPAYRPTPYHPATTSYPGYQEHDGIFVRLGLGGGYMSTSVSNFNRRGKLTYSGGGFSLTAAVGGSIAPNLVLYGEFAGMSVVDPDRTLGGYTDTEHGLTLSMLTFGPGLAYYLQPLNMYISGSIGFGYFNFTNNESYDDEGENSDLGFGLSMMMGKEWWVTADWGLGVAAQFQMATAKYYDDRLTGYGFALMFSATYN